MRRPVIAGNWKMYKTQAETRAFFEAFRRSWLRRSIATSSSRRRSLRWPLRSRPRGNRNRHRRAESCTGSAKAPSPAKYRARMLVEAGCRAVIIGHSERRQFFGETDETRATARRRPRSQPASRRSSAWAKCSPSAKRTRREACSSANFEGGVAALTPAEFSRIMVAYEPVWAIGTGRTATPEIAAEAHGLLRELVAARFLPEWPSRFESSTAAASSPTTSRD